MEVIFITSSEVSEAGVSSGGEGGPYMVMRRSTSSGTTFSFFN